MRELLESEGLTIVDDQITGFAKRFWDPAKELNPPWPGEREAGGPGHTLKEGAG